MNNIERAINYLSQGKNVVFPTETVYGLGASIYQENALKQIFLLKNRAQDNPLIVHIHSLDQVFSLAREVPEDFFKLADVFFPGPLTIILPKNKVLSDLITAGLDTVALRMPSHPIALQLLKGLDEPVAAPSANLSGRPSPTCKQHVEEDFGERIPLILDGGPCELGIESTVISLVGDPTVLRPGSITKKDLERVLEKPVLTNVESDKALCPGMKYRHYAPDAKVSVFEDLQELLEYADQSTWILSNSNLGKEGVFPYSSKSIYSLFRSADEKKIEKILIYLDKETKEDVALVNRINKASSSKIVY